MRINTAPGWALGTHEDQHSPLAKADQGISSSGMGSDLAWTAPILSQPLNQNQPLISSLISIHNSVSVEFNSIPLQAMYYPPCETILLFYQPDFLKRIIELWNYKAMYIYYLRSRAPCDWERALRLEPGFTPTHGIRLLSRSNSELSDSQP